MGAGPITAQKSTIPVADDDPLIVAALGQGLLRATDDAGRIYEFLSHASPRTAGPDGGES